MKLIEDNLPEQWEEGDGSLLFTHDGYMYEIFSLDGFLSICRQPTDEYYDGLNNWEKVEGWVPENSDKFKLLKGYKQF